MSEGGSGGCLVGLVAGGRGTHAHQLSSCGVVAAGPASGTRRHPHVVHTNPIPHTFTLTVFAGPAHQGAAQHRGVGPVQCGRVAVTHNRVVRVAHGRGVVRPLRRVVPHAHHEAAAPVAQHQPHLASRPAALALCVCGVGCGVLGVDQFGGGRVGSDAQRAPLHLVHQTARRVTVEMELVGLGLGLGPERAE